MSRRLEDLEPETRRMCEAFLAAVEAAGLRVTVVHTLRSNEEQALLYAKGRSRPGPAVTNAKPGYSFHNFGRAFDVAFLTPSGKITWEGPWDRLGEIGEAVGLRWGGRFKKIIDRPHFENPGKSLAALRQEAREHGGLA